MTLSLITERLELRAYRSEDIPRIHEILYGNTEARRLTGGVWDVARTTATIDGYIRSHELDGFSFWAVIERATGDIVGEAGLKPLADQGPEIELGYAFGPDYWGRGYATESGRAILHEAFEVLGLERVVADAHEDNTGSRNVLAKLGFTPAGRRKLYDADLLFFELERD